MEHPDHLPRLDAPAYRGAAWVHWTMTTRDRSTGWLDDRMHGRVRELLLHTMTRHFLHCAASGSSRRPMTMCCGKTSAGPMPSRTR
jgi:hypothetical protein